MRSPESVPGASDERRCVVVNADDFGLSPGINRGVIEAHERGIVTSASLMVRRPAARPAADYARARSRLSLGLHFDVGEWAYERGEWVARDQVVDAQDARAVREELDRQLSAFRELLGRDPSHLDSHQHVHRDGPAREAMTEAAARLEIPLRHFSHARYWGAFYGQSGRGELLPDLIGADALIGLVAGLPPGLHELSCHPGDGSDVGLSYGAERAAEVRTLCDSRVSRAIADLGIRLCSFRDLPARFD